MTHDWRAPFGKCVCGHLGLGLSKIAFNGPWDAPGCDWPRQPELSASASATKSLKIQGGRMKNEESQQRLKLKRLTSCLLGHWAPG